MEIRSIKLAFKDIMSYVLLHPHNSMHVIVQSKILISKTSIFGFP
jgi:hypothetical protein